MEKMVQAVKAHAMANYSKDGWDSIVEAYTDVELAEEITRLGATNEAEAIKAVGKGCKAWQDKAEDIRAEAEEVEKEDAQSEDNGDYSRCSYGGNRMCSHEDCGCCGIFLEYRSDLRYGAYEDER
jgi:hypothetical protein